MGDVYGTGNTYSLTNYSVVVRIDKWEPDWFVLTYDISQSPLIDR